MLIVFDLDGFKGYNDSFGHSAGDEMLGRVANRLALAPLGHGRAYRLGGDEFCILATPTDRGRPRPDRKVGGRVDGGRARAFPSVVRTASS